MQSNMRRYMLTQYKLNKVNTITNKSNHPNDSTQPHTVLRPPTATDCPKRRNLKKDQRFIPKTTSKIKQQNAPLVQLNIRGGINKHKHDKFPKCKTKPKLDEQFLTFF